MFEEGSCKINFDRHLVDYSLRQDSTRISKMVFEIRNQDRGWVRLIGYAIRTYFEKSPFR